jgi:ELWxxDGT repeat protein
MAGLAMMSAAADPLPVTTGDFNTEAAPGGSISALYAVGSQIFFLGKDMTHGTELWRSDGTTAGTWMVKDIVAGSADSGVDMLGQTNGLLLFSIPSGESAGVWRSDGTSEGTFQVAEVTAKGARSLGGLMWFDGTAPGATAAESEPWRTDGTVEGTFSLGLASQAAAVAATSRSITPRSVIITLPIDWVGPSQPLRFQFASMSGGHFFINGDRGLWKSGGTVETTQCISALPEYAGSLVRIENSGSWLSVLSSHPEQRFDWWASNGRTGDLVHLCDGAEWTTFQIIGRIGDVSVAKVTLTHTSVPEFWKSDGTPEGTVRIPVGNVDWYANPSGFTVSNGRIYISAQTFQEGLEPWVLDPQAGSLGMLKDIRPKELSSSPGNYRSVGDAVYFTAEDKRGRCLWTSVGKSAGTKAMTSLLPKGWTISNARMSSLGDTLYFTASHRDLGTALWRKDPKGKKAVRVAATITGNGSFLAPEDFFVDAEASGDTVYFLGNDGSDRLLWRTNGSPAGTYPLEAPRVKATRGDASSSLSVVNDRIVFSGPDPVDKGQFALLAATDRQASAGRIAGIPAESYPEISHSMVRSGDHAYFVGTDARLWASDGTAAGTFRFEMAVNQTGPGYPIPDGEGAVFFFANHEGASGGIWFADAASGTMAKVDPLRGECLTVQGGDLYFVRRNAAMELCLWRNTGVAGSTTEVASIPGAVSMRSSAGLLWIDALWPWEENRRELWRSDGTAEGTFAVATSGRDTKFEVIPGIQAGQPCLFFARTGSACEFWLSDGTEGGTQRLIEDALEWNSNSIVVGDRIYFSGNDGIHGHELWVSDGTAVGTVMVTDLTGDSGSSSPAHFVLAGTRLYFTAVTEESGREWYTLDLSAQ